MAVVVQRFLRAERSGVMFTRFAGPDGRPSILVEHVEGDCEKLVKGEVTPDRLWLSEADDIPESLEGPLRPVHARQLAQVAKQLEESFGSPQDVEWVIYDDALHIVQSRPITAAFSDDAITGAGIVRRRGSHPDRSAGQLRYRIGSGPPGVQHRTSAPTPVRIDPRHADDKSRHGGRDAKLSRHRDRRRRDYLSCRDRVARTRSALRRRNRNGDDDAGGRRACHCEWIDRPHLSRPHRNRRRGEVDGPGAVVGHLVRMDGGHKGKTRSRPNRLYRGGIESNAFRPNERCPCARPGSENKQARPVERPRSAASRCSQGRI